MNPSRMFYTQQEFTSTPNVFKQVEELDKMCKQNGINRNPYTSYIVVDLEYMNRETIYTITALKEEFVRLLHRIENSLKVCILEREKEGLTPEQQKTVMVWNGCENGWYPRRCSITLIRIRRVI